MGSSAQPGRRSPAADIFTVLHEDAASLARCGELRASPTPAFAVLTSNVMPEYIRPELLFSTLKGNLLFEVPVGDVLLRKELVAEGWPAEGGKGCWPHLKEHTIYCAFRNPRHSPSVHGGDALCAIETISGRKKVGPKEVLELQRVLRADLVAAPGEEVELDISGHRRLHRTVTRAGEWLKEICEAKADEGSSWHIIAAIQGGKDLKLRQKSCETSLEHPISGAWVGGLGYDESVAQRGEVLRSVTAALPSALPRFLPLNIGNPIEVLQGVLLGVDVFEVPYPTKAASEGIALTFQCVMPGDGPSETEVEEALRAFLPQPGPGVGAAVGQGAGESAAGPGGAEEAKANAPQLHSPQCPEAVHQIRLRADEFREDFSPICEGTPIPKYSRAYICHLLEVRELLAMMLLVQHNLHRYSLLFEEIRRHVQQGTIRRYAAWFLKTQTCEAPPAQPVLGPARKRRRM